jgi:hypothetical protein
MYTTSSRHPSGSGGRLTVIVGTALTGCDLSEHFLLL